MSENIERIINYNIMKKYLLGILFILTIINMVESRLTADHEVNVPADPNNPGNKTGYINDGQSHFCPGYQGRGWVEKHAIDVGLNCY